MLCESDHFEAREERALCPVLKRQLVRAFAFLLFMLALTVIMDRPVCADTGNYRILAGNDRYETARLFCAAYTKENGTVPDEVILVTGQDFPDALAANALAGAKNCPIVLSRRQSLPAATEALFTEDWDRQVAAVTFVGGGFDPAVKEALVSRCGVTSVDDTSFAGKDRYDTADKVCRHLLSIKKTGKPLQMGEMKGRACFVTTGRTAADALSAAAWSCSGLIPILLTDSKGELKAASKELADQFDVILILGGDSVVSEATEKAFGNKALRIGGGNRYETSANIAYHFAAHFCCGKVRAAVFAPGKNANFPDALVAGPYAGLSACPVLLVNGSLSADAKETFNRLFDYENYKTEDICFGGAAAVDGIPAAVMADLKKGEESAGQYAAEVFLTGAHKKPSEDAGLKAGAYKIRSAKVPSLVWSVPDGAVGDAGILLERAQQASRQTFIVTPCGDGTYSIVNEASGYSLDVPGAATESRMPLRQHRRNQTAAQRFFIRKGPDGLCTITPSHTDKVAGVRECRAAEKAEPQIYHYMGCASQFVIFEETETVMPDAGVYMIHSAADDAGVLTMASADKGAGVLLRLERAASSKALRQRFVISHFADGWFISPLTSHLALDVKGGTMADGTAVQQYVWNGSAAQFWQLIPDGRGGFKIASAKDEAYYLTPSAPGKGKDSDAVIRAALAEEAKIWQSYSLEKIDAQRTVPDGVYQIAAFDEPELVFDVENASRSYKANVRLHKANETNAQQFSILYQGNGFYKIKNVNAAQTLDCAGGGSADGTNIQQYKDNGTDAQKWRFISSRDGSWHIFSPGGKALDCEGNSPANNANIRLWQVKAGSSQRFVPQPVKVKMITDLRGMPAGLNPEEGTFDRSHSEKYFTVDAITAGDAVYSRIIGRSYPNGCPLPLTSLRYIKALHVNFNGRTQVGEMITNVSIASDVAAVLTELYKADYQICQMRLVDDFWAGDAERTDSVSMAKDNSSSFNYRRGSNQTTGLSYHAYGWAVDINPLENPYVEFDGAGRLRYYEPANAAAYLDRSTGNPHYITSSDPACRLFKARGFRWLGDNSNPVDYQHFERPG